MSSIGIAGIVITVLLLGFLFWDLSKPADILTSQEQKEQEEENKN